MDPIKLKTVTEQWIPSLQKVYGDDSKAIKKAISARLKQGDEEVPIVNEQGEPVEVEEVILVGAPPSGEAENDDEGEGGGEEEVMASLQAVADKAVKNAFDKASSVDKRLTKAARAITGGHFRNDDKGKQGFKHAGEFMTAVRKACSPQREFDKRLLTKDSPTTFGQEAIGADGGFAVPPDFRAEIMALVEGEESLLAQTDTITIGSNNMTFPTDETTDWQTSGGILANTTAEGGQKTQSKPELQEVNMRLNKITALVPVTDELLEDAPALNSYVPQKAGQKIDFEVSRQIVRGTGAGQATGFLNSGAIIEITRDTANEIRYPDIIGMYSRMYAPCHSRAVWLIHHEVLPELFNMSFDEAASPKQAVYLSPTGLLADAPFGTIFGRPVIVHQAASALGTAGDISYVCLPEYRTLTKTGGVRSDTSIHLFFDFDITTFRFVMRMTGQTKLSAPIDPLNGTTTLSPFVTLAA